MAAVSAGTRVVVGVEIHARVKATTKLFSGASALARDPVSGRPPVPNSQVGWLDAAIPGAMPRLNQFCVDQAIATGIALEGKIQPWSMFERKHYFYCDSPLGYQITQQSHPIVVGGKVELSNKKTVNLSRIQLEQDTAKSFHHQHVALVDFNRAGAALMEIVSDPDMSSPEEASEYVRTVHRLLRHIGSCDGNMEDGSLRADVNVSIVLGDNRRSHRVEVKNLNSLRSIERAIGFEKTRLESLPRESHMSETRSFDVRSGETIPMREKEGKVDYRFMPEPDLPPLIVSQERVEHVKRLMNELPERTRKRLVNDLKLRATEIDILLNNPALLSYLETVACKAKYASPGLIANILCNTILGAMRKEGLEDDPSVSPIIVNDLAELVDRLSNKALSNQRAKDLISEQLVKGQPIAWSSIDGVHDEVKNGMIRQVCKEVLLEFKDEVAKYKQGKKTLSNFFFGKAFARLKGAGADVDQVKGIIKELLEKE